jgi:hypothetical protein
MQDSGFFIMVPDGVLPDNANQHVTITATSREFELLVANTATFPRRGESFVCRGVLE